MRYSKLELKTMLAMGSADRPSSLAFTQASIIAILWRRVYKPEFYHLKGRLGWGVYTHWMKGYFVGS